MLTKAIISKELSIKHGLVINGFLEYARKCAYLDTKVVEDRVREWEGSWSKEFIG